MQLSGKLAAVLELNGDGNRPPQICARGASCRPWLRELSHSCSDDLVARTATDATQRTTGRAYRRAVRVERRSPVVGPSGASFSSRIHMPCRRTDKSDNDARRRRCAATRNGACNLFREAALRNSLCHHLIPVFPVIEPAGKEGPGPATEQVLKRKQERIWRLRF